MHCSAYYRLSFCKSRIAGSYNTRLGHWRWWVLANASWVVVSKLLHLPMLETAGDDQTGTWPDWMAGGWAVDCRHAECRCTSLTLQKYSSSVYNFISPFIFGIQFD